MQTSNPVKMEEESTIHQAMQLTTAIALPMALKAAMDLGLLEIMQEAGPSARLSPSEIAARVAPNTNNLTRTTQMMDRILRLLSSYSVVSCTIADDAEHSHNDGQVLRLYTLAPLSRFFLHSKDEQGSLAPMFNMIHDKFMTNTWYHMKDAILEGEVPLVKAYGKNPIDAINNDEIFAPIFFQAMGEFNHLFINKVLNEYNGFEDLKSVVDVGGGNGSILKAIISKYPNIKGINFDLQQVIEKQPIQRGVELVAGNMFTSIPTGDAIFMKWVLKNLDDEQCLKVLKNCFTALPDGGKLMVAEVVLPDIPDSTISSQSVFQFDVYLTNMNAGGKERTRGEFQALAKAAGFPGIKAMVPAFDNTLLEFHKTASTH